MGLRRMVMALMVKTGKLEQTFAVITPEQGVEQVAVTPTMYAELDDNFAGSDYLRTVWQ